MAKKNCSNRQSKQREATMLPDFDSPDFIQEIKKRKLNSGDLYLITLRQILLNQAFLLSEVSTYGHSYKLATRSQEIAKRIEEFCKTRE